MNAPQSDEQRFARPTPVTGLDLAFGGDIEKLMPAYRSLPESFQRERDPWSRLVHKWFFSGLDTSALKPKDGINKAEALKHCQAIMASFTPKHEHKIAGVAWLMSQWFEEPTHVQ